MSGNGTGTAANKPWYKTWWGILVAICIWPFFLVWFAWSKSHWGKGARIAATVLGVFGLIISVAVMASSGHPTTPVATAVTPTPSTPAQATSTPAPKTTPTPKPAPTRQVSGTAVTLGAGTFTGGKDVASGLYDVTPGAGQSGNFMVDGDDSYNEILGVSESQGIPKVRVKISSGDKITISSLSVVAFTPVSTPFSTSYSTTSLYSGTFIVGEDIVAGRYVATPGAGQSGNFMVDGSDSYNEILGGSSANGGVPSLTVNLTKGDIISISSLSQVIFTPSK
jgi:hypothetical protein